jgi:hypothetical protein
MKTIAIHFEMTDNQAWALAQLMKRLGFDDCRKLAESDDEAYAMLYASDVVRMALAREGIVPR